MCIEKPLKVKESLVRSFFCKKHSSFVKTFITLALITPLFFLNTAMSFTGHQEEFPCSVDITNRGEIKIVGEVHTSRKAMSVVKRNMQLANDSKIIFGYEARLVGFENREFNGRPSIFSLEQIIPLNEKVKLLMGLSITLYGLEDNYLKGKDLPTLFKKTEEHIVGIMYSHKDLLNFEGIPSFKNPLNYSSPELFKDAIRQLSEPEKQIILTEINQVMKTLAQEIDAEIRKSNYNRRCPRIRWNSMSSRTLFPFLGSKHALLQV